MNRETWTRLFRTDQWLWLRANQIFHVLLLNFCWLLGTLPVITWGVTRLALVRALQTWNPQEVTQVAIPFIAMIRDYWRRGLVLGGLDLFLRFLCIGCFLIVLPQTDPLFLFWKIALLPIYLWIDLYFFYAYPLVARGVWGWYPLCMQILGQLVGHPVRNLVLLMIPVLVAFCCLSHGVSLLLYLFFQCTIGQALWAWIQVWATGKSVVDENGENVNEFI
ncbi:MULTISPECIES: hypothetical protein [unclassified Streptococcus]|uniref:hypothetical protein n=1 Tax=unclassified Streptococcus TaxID=2608887 RepID=UPI0018CA67B7|nr:MULTISPECIES: hypothetical protein [unclassified Streptococcus]MBG9367842.1 hypothetical protein [Streptococcus sp. NLN64]MBJ6745836.1 hypothetical protein [Streptococcus sp. 121]